MSGKQGICKFHVNHGENITLSRRGAIATRTAKKSFSYGIVFTSEPVTVGHILQVTVLKRAGRFAGGLGLYFTTENPHSSTLTQLWTTALLFEKSAQTLTGICADNILHRGRVILPSTSRLERSTGTLGTGESIGIRLTEEDELECYWNGELCRTVVVKGCSQNRPLWGVVDVYGSCIAVRADICTTCTGPLASMVQQGQEDLQSLQELIEQQEQTRELEAELEELVKSCDSHKMESESKREENERLRAELSSSRDQLEELRKKLAEEQGARKALNGHLATEREARKEEAERKSKKNFKLTRTIQELQCTLHDQEKQLENKDKEISELNNKFEEAKSQEADSKSSERCALTQQIQELQDEIVTHKQQLECKEQEIIELNSKLEQTIEAKSNADKKQSDTTEQLTMERDRYRQALVSIHKKCTILTEQFELSTREQDQQGVSYQQPPELKAPYANTERQITGQDVWLKL